MKNKFIKLYSDMIQQQLTDGIALEDIDIKLHLSIMKVWLDNRSLH